MPTRVTNISDAPGGVGTLHLASNWQWYLGGKGKARKAAAEQLALIRPGAEIVSVSYAGRDPSMRQATPYRYLVTFRRPA